MRVELQRAATGLDRRHVARHRHAAEPALGTRAREAARARDAACRSSTAAGGKHYRSGSECAWLGRTKSIPDDLSREAVRTPKNA
jgi:hypothetical protein